MHSSHLFDYPSADEDIQKHVLGHIPYSSDLKLVSTQFYKFFSTAYPAKNLLSSMEHQLNLVTVFTDNNTDHKEKNVVLTLIKRENDFPRSKIFPAFSKKLYAALEQDQHTLAYDRTNSYKIDFNDYDSKYLRGMYEIALPENFDDANEDQGALFFLKIRIKQTKINEVLTYLQSLKIFSPQCILLREASDFSLSPEHSESLERFVEVCWSFVEKLILNSNSSETFKNNLITQLDNENINQVLSHVTMTRACDPIEQLDEVKYITQPANF